MSYPPAPGTGTGASSLPPRPPPSIHQPPATNSNSTSSSAATSSSTPSVYSGFRPRQVATPAAPGTQPALRYSATYAGSGQQNALQGPGGSYGGGAHGKPTPAAASYQKQPYLSYSHTYAGAPTVNPGYQQQQAPQQPQQPQQQPQPQYGQQQPPQHHQQHQPQAQQHHQGYQQQQQQQSGYGSYNNAGQHGYDQQQQQQHHSQPHNRGGAGGAGGGGYNNRNNQYGSGLDPDFEAQIAEQQSIYDPVKRAALAAAAAANPAGAPGSGVIGPTDPNYAVDGATPPATAAPKPKPNATVKRSGGGQSWNDDTLLEWNPAHFRLFVGNLAGEVTDDSLLKAFAAYPSVQKARVIRDKRTTKSKGYGFVAFEDGDDYFLAAKEMQGKYIGSHPVLLRKSTTEIKATPLKDKKGKNKNKNKNKGNGGVGGGGGGGGGGYGGGNIGGGVLGKKSGDGVKKKDKGPKLLG